MFEKGVTSPGNSTSNHCLKLRRFNFPLLVKVINNNVFINVFKCFAYVFILILRESFNNRFQDDIQEGSTILIKKTITQGFRLLTTSARRYFRRSLRPTQEEERGLISLTATGNRAEISAYMLNGIRKHTGAGYIGKYSSSVFVAVVVVVFF